MFVNTELFRTEAKHFLKYGYYCPDPAGSLPWMDYWNEQNIRIREGYSVGGVKITGHHYSYLNFGQIRLTQTENEESLIAKNRVKTGRKILTFPDFWDGDYDYFWNFEICRFGMAEDKVKALNLINTPTLLDGGHHLLIAKSRRKGFSYKNGKICANTYNTIRNSTTLIGAFEKKYLYPKGTMTMAVNYLNFYNEHTAWVKRRQGVNKQEHVRASYFEYINGQPIEKGYKSDIIAITFKDNPDAARGKDSELILFEEGGKFNNLKDSFMATKPTVEDGSVTTGMIVIFGTGGDMDGGTIDMEEMFYNPEPYNLLPYNNTWDEGANGSICSFFFPDKLNKIGFIDKDGNSLKDEAEEYETEKRELIKKNAKSSAVYDKHITEYSNCPREAFLRTSNNIFPTIQLNEWRGYLQSKNLYNSMGVPGYLSDDSAGGVKFLPSQSVKIITKFPHNRLEDLTGGLVVYQVPYRSHDGSIPDNMYTIFHDPYGNDTDGGASLGSAFVYKKINNISSPDDMLVASYVGRPKTQDEYNMNLFMLAQYYNAKIGFENDRGDVIGYAKRFKKLGWLKSEVEIIDKTHNINIRKLGRKYGMSMGSEERKAQAEIYLRDWLVAPRGKTEDGKQSLNLHFIYDIPLLDELIRYYRKGNYDRVSALLVGMYYIKDETLRPVVENRYVQEDDFFSRDFF